MIVTIAEQFTSDPSDRERSPTIIWKPGFSVNHKAKIDDRADIVQVRAISGACISLDKLLNHFLADSFLNTLRQGEQGFS